jgi:hypothetical protein
MFRLYGAGKSPAEIAHLCDAGTAGVAAFTVPRRTCHEIVTSMAAEAEQNLPISVAEVESAESVERFPVRIAALVDAEIGRLTKKQERNGLTPEDFDRLRKASDLSFDLHRRLSRRKPNPTRPRGARQAARTEAPEESVIERIAREAGERLGEEDHLAHTPTQPPPVYLAPVPGPARQTPFEAVRQVAAEHGIDVGDVEDYPVTPAKQLRQEARLKARAALGYDPVAKTQGG